MKRYLEETSLLNYSHPLISQLVKKRGWDQKLNKDKVYEIYSFVKDEIPFGYNVDDEIPASKVLSDGYGQCNTKSILFMSLLRAVNIPCRIHGFTVNKSLQKGVLNGLWYRLTPEELFHTWVEVYYEDKWLNMEGLILDADYLSVIQKKYNHCTGSFCGYGVATDNLSDPDVDWNENDTYIQKEDINKNLGVFDNPDSFFDNHKQKLNFFKKTMFRQIIRHNMNRNVNRIRNVKFKEEQYI